jgi:hypothetical protein
MKEDKLQKYLEKEFEKTHGYEMQIDCSLKLLDKRLKAIETRQLTSHQELCKRLKPGMKVKILRRCPGYTDGWDNEWNPDMDKYIGEVHKIKEIRGNAGVRLEGCERNGWDFFWPAQVLEPVNEPIGDTTKYKLIKPVLTPSGMWDDGIWHVEGEVEIPNALLDRAIKEDFYAKGMGVVKKLTIDGNTWVVL